MSKNLLMCKYKYLYLYIYIIYLYYIYSLYLYHQEVIYRNGIPVKTCVTIALTTCNFTFTRKNNISLYS